jgi:hypothetical protein
MVVRNLSTLAAFVIFALALSTYAGEKKTVTYVNKFGSVQHALYCPSPIAKAM